MTRRLALHFVRQCTRVMACVYTDFICVIGLIICFLLAKKAFSLTEAEMLTLPHESITNSPKTFALDAIKALARRKHRAGALLMDPVDQAMLNATVWKKIEDNGRRNRTNWRVGWGMEIPGSLLNLALEMTKAELVLHLIRFRIITHILISKRKAKEASGAVGKSS